MVVIFPRKFLGIKGTMLAEREECLGRTAHVSYTKTCLFTYLFQIVSEMEKNTNNKNGIKFLGNGTEEISIETYKIWNISFSEQSYRGSQL